MHKKFLCAAAAAVGLLWGSLGFSYGEMTVAVMAYATIDAKKGEDKQVKEYIDKNVLKENDMINVFSVLDMKESFQQFVSKYYMIGSFLVVILALSLIHI